jgi:hypothetical protein
MATIRWGRYVVPVMVEIDCDNDAIGRVVALTGEAREDRDDRGQFCIYDETFVRRHADGQVETHALWVANPPNGRILRGPPQDWPALFDWEDVFDEPDADGVTEDDRYGETGPTTGRAVRDGPRDQRRPGRRVRGPPQSVGLGDRFPRRAGEVRRGRLTGDRPSA